MSREAELFAESEELSTTAKPPTISVVPTGRRMRTRTEYRELIAAVSETDIARLAAFIDGEGCIFINQRNRAGRMVTPQLSLSLVITNTHCGFINWLKAMFDGSVYFVKYEKCKHLGRKQIMRWQVNERM